MRQRYNTCIYLFGFSILNKFVFLLYNIADIFQICSSIGNKYTLHLQHVGEGSRNSVFQSERRCFQKNIPSSKFSIVNGRFQSNMLQLFQDSLPFKTFLTIDFCCFRFFLPSIIETCSNHYKKFYKLIKIHRSYYKLCSFPMKD